MTWTPIGEAELKAMIAGAVAVMEPPALQLWSLIRVRPVKWSSLPPWGELTGGFWVVGLLGEEVLWFNDIEWGFNVSRYDENGVIGHYWCNQEELQHTMYFLLQRIESFESRSNSPDEVDFRDAYHRRD